MTDLQEKAMKMALDVLRNTVGHSNQSQTRIDDAKHALVQALAQPEPRGHCTCGDPKALGVMHFRTRPCIYYTPQSAQPVVAINKSQERVDETAKSEQEGIVMNKILKKLGEKAGVCPIKHIGGGEWDSYLPEAEQKFAELIVDECCLKLLNMDEKTKGSHNYYKHAALEIKKHFEITDEAKLKEKNSHD